MSEVRYVEDPDLDNSHVVLNNVDLFDMEDLADFCDNNNVDLELDEMCDLLKEVSKKLNKRDCERSIRKAVSGLIIQIVCETLKEWNR